MRPSYLLLCGVILAAVATAASLEAENSAAAKNASPIYGVTIPEDGTGGQEMQ